MSEEFKDDAFWDFVNHDLNINLPEAETMAAPPASVPRERGFENGSDAVDEQLRQRVRAMVDELLSELPNHWDRRLAGHHKTVRDEIVDYLWQQFNARYPTAPLGDLTIAKMFLEAGWIILGQLIKDGDVNGNTSS